MSLIFMVSIRIIEIFSFFWGGGGWGEGGGLRHIFFRKKCIIFRDFEEKLA